MGPVEPESTREPLPEPVRVAEFYVRPVLVVLGSIDGLTQGFANMPGDDVTSGTTT